MTSFLDLCCCALGGVILLMVLLVPTPGEDPSGEQEPVEHPVEISVDLPVLSAPNSPSPSEIPAGFNGYQYPLTARTAKVTLVINNQTVLAGEEMIVGPPRKITNFSAPVTWSVTSRRTGEDEWMPQERLGTAPRMPRSLHQLRVEITPSVADDLLDDLQFGLTVEAESPTATMPSDLRPMLEHVATHYEAAPGLAAGDSGAALPGAFPSASVTVFPTQETARASLPVVPVMKASEDGAITEMGVQYAQRVPFEAWQRQHLVDFSKNRWPHDEREFYSPSQPLFLMDQTKEETRPALITFDIFGGRIEFGETTQRVLAPIPAASQALRYQLYWQGGVRVTDTGDEAGPKVEVKMAPVRLTLLP